LIYFEALKVFGELKTSRSMQAPAAFGLVTFLLHAGLERNRIRRHLLVFAVAAPFAAIGTYFTVDEVSERAKL
jgi:zinc transporter 9